MEAPSGTRGGGAIDGRGGVRGKSGGSFGGGGRSGSTSGGSILDRFGGWLESHAPTATKGASLGLGFGGLPGAAIGAGIGGLADMFGGFGGFGGLGGGGGQSNVGGGQRGGEGPGPRERGVATPMTTLAKPGKGTPAWARPDAATPPGWMRFDPIMSDLQRRSYIATEGLSGNQGLYRSDEAKSYYANLLARQLIGPNGQLGDYNTLLPIEQQYLQALGIPQWKDTAGLLTGLGLKPGQATGQQGLLPRTTQRMPGSGPTDGLPPQMSSLRALLAGAY